MSPRAAEIMSESRRREIARGCIDWVAALSAGFTFDAAHRVIATGALTPQQVAELGARRFLAIGVSGGLPVHLPIPPLRYLHEVYPLQQLLQFYPQDKAMARRSATRKCQFGAETMHLTLNG
jgi:hypothetical protein